MNKATVRCAAGLAAALLAPALLAGCDRAPERAGTASSVEPSAAGTSAPATASAPAASASEPTATGSSPAVSGPGRPGGDPTPLAIEQRHPNGSVLRVTSLTVEPNAIRVALQVVNGDTRDLTLGFIGNTVTLTDDVGGVYEFIEPPDNPDLEIQPRGTLTGELVFFGVLNPGASSLRLQTNSQASAGQSVKIYDPATESANAALPHFSVEIPLKP